VQQVVVVAVQVHLAAQVVAAAAVKVVATTAVTTKAVTVTTTTKTTTTWHAKLQQVFEYRMCCASFLLQASVYNLDNLGFSSNLEDELETKERLVVTTWTTKAEAVTTKTTTTTATKACYEALSQGHTVVERRHQYVDWVPKEWHAKATI